MKRVGLTGSIATGKSTVSAYLKEKSIPIIDADLVAKEVMKDPKVIEQLVSTFGEEVKTETGELNRVALGGLIFGSKIGIQLLNDIVQPTIRLAITQKMDELATANVPLVVADIPLLFEQKYESLFDEVIVVYTTPEQQLQRLMKRNHLSQLEAEKRIRSQIAIDDKKELATVVFDNTGDQEKLYQQVEQWLLEN